MDSDNRALMTNTRNIALAFVAVCLCIGGCEILNTRTQAAAPGYRRLDVRVDLEGNICSTTLTNNRK